MRYRIEMDIEIESEDETDAEAEAEWLAASAMQSHGVISAEVAAVVATGSGD